MAGVESSRRRLVNESTVAESKKASEQERCRRVKIFKAEQMGSCHFGLGRVRVTEDLVLSSARKTAATGGEAPARGKSPSYSAPSRFSSQGGWDGWCHVRSGARDWAAARVTRGE